MIKKPLKVKLLEWYARKMRIAICIYRCRKCHNNDLFMWSYRKSKNVVDYDYKCQKCSNVVKWTEKGLKILDRH